ncbi:hypothetical protein JCGZ_12688 [Jatropha curcas]|uniref:Uncharacterized protein n=1 Tax=Jatropha curcas TaxID=180498 RepID=A0A067KE66_JATCU|nr:hypothetical protein JCGZ_12688 [Jatropha curcas]
MADNHETRLTAIEARFEELAEQIRQLTLAIQQGNPQPATTIAAPNPHQPDYARCQNRYDGGRDHRGNGDNFQDEYKIKVDLQPFSGSLDIESTLDCLAEVDRFFEILGSL